MDMKSGWEAHQSARQAERRSAFLRQLQVLSDKVRAADKVDAVLTGLVNDICALFGCDRLTLYVVSPSKTAIETRVKTGMDSFKDFSLPIANSSIAGHVALTRRAFNIHDVYSEEELRNHSRELRFLDKVDRRLGYRTREMIAAPIIDAQNGELLGVLQLINNRLGGPFPELMVDGAREFCSTLAEAFQRLEKSPLPLHTRFDPLIVQGSLSAAELDLAKRFARRRKLDLEDVLLDAFKVSVDQLGAAYAHFFKVPYEPYRAGRGRSTLLQSVGRAYAAHNEWLVLEDMGPALTVLALDPDRLRAARRVEGVFPQHAVKFRVTTRREFFQTLDQLYGVDRETARDKAQAALRERVRKIVAAALAREAPELQAQITAGPGRPSDGASAGQVTISLDISCRATEN